MATVLLHRRVVFDRFLFAFMCLPVCLQTLKEGFEGEMNENNIDIGIITDDRKFRVLSPAQVGGSPLSSARSPPVLAESLSFSCGPFLTRTSIDQWYLRCLLYLHVTLSDCF